VLSPLFVPRFDVVARLIDSNQTNKQIQKKKQETREREREAACSSSGMNLVSSSSSLTTSSLSSRDMSSRSGGVPIPPHLSLSLPPNLSRAQRLIAPPLRTTHHDVIKQSGGGDPDEKFLANLRERLQEDEEELDEEQEEEVLDTLLEIIGEKREGSASAKAAIEWYAINSPPTPEAALALLAFQG
jgi:hypothetical protein